MVNKRLPPAALAALALLTVWACAASPVPRRDGDGSTPRGTSQPAPTAAPGRPLAVRIVQEFSLDALRFSAAYDAWFDGAGSGFKLEGEIKSGSQTACRLTLASDGEVLTQLVSSAAGAAACKYDLAALRADSADFEPARSWSPVAYAQLARAWPGATVAAGEDLLEYILPARGQVHRPGRTGLNAPLGTIKVQVSQKDGLTRLVQFCNKEGAVLMTLRYEELRPLAELPANALKLAIPRGVTVADGTETLRTLVRQSKGEAIVP